MDYNKINMALAIFAGATVTEPYPANKDIPYQEFMFKFPDDKYDPCAFPGDQKWHSISGLKYHESWSWLMPLIDKIEGLEFNPPLSYIRHCGAKVLSLRSYYTDSFRYFYFDISELNSDVKSEDITGSHILCKNKFEAYYLAVYQYVLWYNMYNKKKREKELNKL